MNMTLAGDDSLGDLTDRELRQRVSRSKKTLAELEAVPPSEVVRNGRAEEYLKAMDASIATIEETTTELSRRAEKEKRSRVREAVEAVPRFRELEKRRSRNQHPALGTPLRWLQRTKPPEIEGVNLDVSRLTHNEGHELAEICKRFWDAPAGAEREAADVARFEELVGQWAGDVTLFQNQRRKAEVEERMAKIKEAQRVAALPKRPLYAEQGSVTLPRFLFEWVRDSRNGEWTVADTGMLVVMLQQFENRTPLIAGATFEEEDGEHVLVIPGAIGSDIRFQGRANGDSLDSTDSGHVRVKVALSACVRNKWLTAEQAGGQLRIKLGERARKVREGKEEAKASS
jgi:hypothetical protein